MLSNPAPICYYKNMKKLTIKEAKYTKARIEGKNKRTAGLIAGATTEAGADKYANRMSKNVHVQKLIDEAMDAEGLTANKLISELRSVIEQDKEIGAKRLAIKDGLELLGWQRGERPNVTLDIKNANFFGQTRQQD